MKTLLDYFEKALHARPLNPGSGICATLDMEGRKAGAKCCEIWAEMPVDALPFLARAARKIDSPEFRAKLEGDAAVVYAAAWEEDFDRAIRAMCMALRHAGIDRPVIVQRAERELLEDGGFKHVTFLDRWIAGPHGHDALCETEGESEEETIARVAAEVACASFAEEAVDLARQEMDRWEDEYHEPMLRPDEEFSLDPDGLRQLNAESQTEGEKVPF